MAKQDRRTSGQFSTWCIEMARWQAEGYEALYQWQRIYERNKPHGRHAAPEPPRVSNVWVGPEFVPSSTGRYRRALIGGDPPPADELRDGDNWELMGLLNDVAAEPEVLDTRTEFTGH